jgi:serine/threonine-protein kinase
VQQPIQVLDKYELLERVGQGGMAIVYRGLDRSLKRVVAIKVLHKHLADYQEARDRFEREAQAVAKLRHENILEIFDFSAKPDSEAYIVTEFIDGQTLKQAITARPIAFPEIGAMIIVQVGRALAHAHAGGILHRDVKPENIMIRGDGVVKLMDFGISHMVDLERLTVTGQLLGSPAYMAPEHVEGRPLDYRTDVFAAGIVLYQLCVGKLPFEGKNPHEVLKRIAECKFVDPRTANRRIGNRLGRIILRAMAREPADRYSGIGLMVDALDKFLQESGIDTDKITAELARYFSSPASYEKALETRLVDTLTRRGQELLDSDRPAALDAFDRVLTIDDKNEKVLAIIDRLNRRARWGTIAKIAGIAAVIAGGAFLIHKKTEQPPPEPPPSPDLPIVAENPQRVVVPDDPPPLEVPPDAEQVAAVEIDAASSVITPVNPTKQPVIDAGVVAPQPLRYQVTLSIFPAGPGTTVNDGKTVMTVPESGLITLDLEGDTHVIVSNQCCESTDVPIPAGTTKLPVALDYLNGAVTAMCDTPNARVLVDDKPQDLGRARPIVFGKSTMNVKAVTVTFLVDPPVTKRVDVHPNEPVTVWCDK